MQVVGDDLGLDREQPLEVLDPLGEGAQRLVVAQVADVRPDPRPRAPGQAERALELGAAGQDRPARGHRQRRGGRDVAAGAAQHRRPSRDDAQRPSRRPARGWAGRGPGRGRRSRAAAPGASSSSCAMGSSETLPLVMTSGLAGLGQQQVVQRRVGQHHAEVGECRGRPRRPPARRAGGGSEHDRALAAGQERPLGRAQRDQRRRRPPRSGAMTAKGLLLAVLARAQRRHRLLVGRPAGQVEAAEPLDGEDRAGRAGPPRRRRPGRRTPRRPAPSSRRRRGPQSGQALGWAWKRRSRGVLVLARGTPGTS